MSAANANFSRSPVNGQRYHAFLSHNGAEKSLVEELAYELGGFCISPRKGSIQREARCLEEGVSQGGTRERGRLGSGK